eukprot:7015106-Lingulodinium_polyedra.AAC.1
MGQTHWIHTVDCCPTELGVPTTGNRNFMVLVRKQFGFLDGELSFDIFKKAVMLDGNVYFNSSTEELDAFYKEVATRRGIDPRNAEPDVLLRPGDWGRLQGAKS